MDSQEHIIHIDWSGPHSLDEVAQFHGDQDWGLYQFYGGHPVYGSGVLLYIGKCESEPGGFAYRVLNSAGRCANNPDGSIQVYLGRLTGVQASDKEAWERDIRLAEQLLILAHCPAYNLRQEGSPSDTDLFRVHVLNWRHHRDLLPEVSGARWTDRFDDVTYGSYFSTLNCTPTSVPEEICKPPNDTTSNVFTATGK